MPLRHSPTIDDLLADTLVQAVMKADRVDPQTLRNLAVETGFRIAAARAEGRSATRPPAELIRRRPTPRDSIVRTRSRNAPDSSGSALCC
jgi:hypothetical protein